MINEDFALAILTISPILKQYNLLKLQIALLFILLIPLLSVLHYSYSFTDANITYTYGSGGFSGISPIVFLFLVIYIIINRSVIVNTFRRFRKGSESEQAIQHDKMVEFYYNKFKECSDYELLEIKSMYKEYPAEAQEAIDKINSEYN